VLIEEGLVMAKKNKTSKSLKKRFRITASGMIKHSKPGKRHLLAGRTPKRKRQLRQPSINNSVVASKYILMMVGE